MVRHLLRRVAHQELRRGGRPSEAPSLVALDERGETTGFNRVKAPPVVRAGPSRFLPQGETIPEPGVRLEVRLTALPDLISEVALAALETEPGRALGRASAPRWRRRRRSCRP